MFAHNDPDSRSLSVIAILIAAWLVAGGALVRAYVLGTEGVPASCQQLFSR